MEVFQFRDVGNGHHTHALGDNTGHDTDYKANQSNHPILISHTAQPIHIINVYVLLTEREREKKKERNVTTDCPQISRSQARDTYELDPEMVELVAMSCKATGLATSNGLLHSKGQVPRRYTA